MMTSPFLYYSFRHGWPEHFKKSWVTQDPEPRDSGELISHIM